MANSLNNLAKLYRDEGKLPESEALYKRSLALREQTYGASDPRVAASLRNYALLLRNMGKTTDADSMDARAETIEAKSEK